MVNIKIKYLVFVCSVSLLFYSCDEVFPEAPAENELLDGPMEGLSFSEQNRFLAGDVAFNDEIFTPESGLGLCLWPLPVEAVIQEMGKVILSPRLHDLGRHHPTKIQTSHLEPHNFRTGPFRDLSRRGYPLESLL
ncbi:hypothetical protein [Fulvivirga kasyanovii]|uniref:hypothetical protein n=1 Tax=Fulvivirga kasyanovii TaxID=396812 RepID=UPI001FEC7EF7|nr:hypothetical protein [Fulvivirga kasyanovii]